MQVFEFYFNPNSKPDLIFESFCYEPENIYEKRKGSLYLTGALKNTLPKNLRFLNNLSDLIKEKYYNPAPRSPEKSFKESLKKANEFLESIAKKGDVSWLGNLNFAALSLTSYQKSWQGIELNFTKVGNLKILLLRDGKIIDIDQKLKFQEIEPYPLKIFNNIISGKLAEKDIILLLSQEIADVFSQENILTEIANMNLFNQVKSFSAPHRLEFSKRLKTIFIAKKEELLKVSGVCLLIVLSKEDKSSFSPIESLRSKNKDKEKNKVFFAFADDRITKESFTKEKQILLSEKSLKIFSLKKIFSNIFKQSHNTLSKSIKKLGIPIIKIPNLKLPKITTNQVRNFISNISKQCKIKKQCLPLSFEIKKKIILILILFLFLLLGFFIFN